MLSVSQLRQMAATRPYTSGAPGADWIQKASQALMDAAQEISRLRDQVQQLESK